MKRLAIISIVVTAVLLLTGVVFAETLIYSPARQTTAAESGNTIGLPFTVIVDGLSVEGEVQFVDTVSSGNLPASWVKASPNTARVDPRSNVASTAIVIEVPAGTPAGTYAGFVRSNLAGPRQVDPGSGSYVTVNVSEAVSCSAAPEMVVDSVSPKEIRVPNNKTIDITVEGSIVNPEGCSRLSATYTLDDEYGEVSASGTVELGTGGAFSVSVPVQASRKGNDTNGRLYSVVFKVENDAAILTKSADVTVLHSGDKK